MGGTIMPFKNLRIQISGSTTPPDGPGYYEEAIRALGATPQWGRCPKPDLTCDGLLISGGADVSPSVYKEEKLPCCGENAPARDLLESWCVNYAMQRRLPILGICRGLQILNCVLGGALYQDIATQYKPDLTHPCYDTPRDCVHVVELPEGTLLREIIGLDAVPINSRHHQAVKKLGRNLRACAFAPDGLIEAVESTDGYPLLGVQWHPESLEDRFLPQRAIFNWLVREASR